MLLLLSIILGVIAGLRSMMPLAAVAWAGYLGWLDLSGTPLAVLTEAWVAWVVLGLAVGELVGDKMPSAPSRDAVLPFLWRLVTGAVGGGALGIAAGLPWVGAALGVLGAVVGTQGGLAVRLWLMERLGALPAAVLEDGVAVGGAVAVVLVVA